MRPRFSNFSDSGIAGSEPHNWSGDAHDIAAIPLRDNVNALPVLEDLREKRPLRESAVSVAAGQGGEVL